MQKKAFCLFKLAEDLNGRKALRNKEIRTSTVRPNTPPYAFQNLFLLKQLGGAQQKRLFHGKQACDASSALCKPPWQQRQRYFGPSTSRNCGFGKDKGFKSLLCIIGKKRIRVTYTAAQGRRCGRNWNIDPARGNWIGGEFSWRGPFGRQGKGIYHDKVVINPHVEHFKLVDHTKHVGFLQLVLTYGTFSSPSLRAAASIKGHDTWSQLNS